MTTLIGSSCSSGGQELGHQHREAAVADVGDDLPAGEGVLDADGVRQPGRHRGQVAGQVELPVAADRPVPRGPGRDRAAVAGQDGVVGGQLVQHGHQVLRRDRVALGVLQGVPCPPATWPSPPGTSRRWRRSARGVSSGSSASQAQLGVADHRHLGRHPHPGPDRVGLDLHDPHLARRGQVLGVGEVRADHEQRVAVLHQLLAGPGAEQPDPARGVRRVVRDRPPCRTAS